ncbi:MAG TPA: thioredoxin family protein [Cytophagaceae bacterium]|jgi:thioredoxin 1|nr:thioredoxin family protein [Cytophagaceae bacterium]
MAINIADDSNFKEQLNAHDKIVVKYYADWCGSCKLFAPKFKRLSDDERFKNIVFLDVNAEKNPEARREGEVKNLPTFAIFKNSKLVESLASNKEDALVELLGKLN